ncbi:unnamed protein product [Peronospora destructor]|uniref:HTH CENPB-type domain-containing protein n=1 Tax=Peronospora destructor TaxID=86335 RepID=A0AAV0VBJ3_9STRA|nr:unnamed protein product [Peronospora destructor]
MVRPKARSTNLTHEQKRLICLHARQFPKTTQTQLGQWAKDQFNLDYVPSQAAMSYMLKKRTQFELVSGEGRDYKKLRTVKCPEVDSALANWFLYCQARRLKLPGDLVRHKARVFYELLAPQLPESVTCSPPQFSNGWMHSFMGRHGFSLGGGKGSKGQTKHEEADGKPILAPETPAISTLDHIKAAVAGVSPENVYWLHETRLFYAMSPDRQALPSNHHPEKKLTMLLALNADGSDRLNPFFVGPHPLSMDSNQKAEERPYQFACNHKAWMPPTMLRDWLMALDWRMRVTNRNIVLIVDSVAAMCVQKVSLSNVKMHFVERNHAGELCVRTLEMGVVAAVKRRYRHQLLDYALDRREEGQLDIYDIPLQKVVEWVAQGWQQIPRSRIIASFAHVGVMIITETNAAVSLDDRIDDKLDAQIQVLLKRSKANADFADSALHAAQGTVGIQLSSDDLIRHTIVQESTKSDSLTPFDMQASSSSPAGPRRNSNNVSNILSNFPGFDQGYPGSLDDSWLSHSAMTAPVRQRMSDFEAVQKTIRLATEMNCDSVVMLELNRIKTEVANRDPRTSTSTTLTAPTTRNAAVCQFHFGASTRRLL